MADETRKKPGQSPEKKDLPPRKPKESDDENVKGGLMPIRRNPEA